MNHTQQVEEIVEETIADFMKEFTYTDRAGRRLPISRRMNEMSVLNTQERWLRTTLTTLIENTERLERERISSVVSNIELKKEVMHDHKYFYDKTGEEVRNEILQAITPSKE